MHCKHLLGNTMSTKCLTISTGWESHSQVTGWDLPLVGLRLHEFLDLVTSVVFPLLGSQVRVGGNLYSIIHSGFRTIQDLINCQNTDNMTLSWHSGTNIYQYGMYIHGERMPLLVYLFTLLVVLRQSLIFQSCLIKNKTLSKVDYWTCLVSKSQKNTAKLKLSLSILIKLMFDTYI